MGTRFLTYRDFFFRNRHSVFFVSVDLEEYVVRTNKKIRWYKPLTQVYLETPGTGKIKE